MIKLNPLTGNFDDVGFPARTITGTTNQISVTNGDGVSGNPTLSLPQDIHTGASPTFGGATISGTYSGASGIELPLSVSPTISQSGTAGYTALKVNVTETATGSGNKNIIDAQVGGVSRFKVSNLGNLSVTSTDDLVITFSTSAVGKAAYFDYKSKNASYCAMSFYPNGAKAGTIGRNGNSDGLNIYNGSDARVARFGNSDTSTTFYGHTAPGTDSTYTLGTPTNYWLATHTDRLYLNSTFNIDGAVAGTGNITGNLGILATSGSATHSLTLGSTSTGIALYNTADQVTNYERVRHIWSGNTYCITSETGGTGTLRAVQMQTFGGGLALGVSSTPIGGATYANAGFGSAGGSIFTARGIPAGSSGVQYGISITPAFAQTGTAGYTALLINPTESTTGSGTKLLIDAQVGGVSKFKVTNGGMPELGVTGEGIVMKSPDGTRYKVTVANGGTIAVAAA